MSIKFKGRIQDDPAITNLLNTMPDPVKNSFSEEQLMHLKTALATRQWSHHPIDIRGTVKGFRNRYYYVFLAGKNKRELSRNEEQASKLMKTFVLTLFLSISMLIGLVAIYLLKSALGINFFEDFSLGLWDWFKS